jgi:hypothetical protein
MSRAKENLNSSDMFNCEDYSINSSLEYAKSNIRSYSNTILDNKKHFKTNNPSNRIKSASSTININRTISHKSINYNNLAYSLFDKNQVENYNEKSFNSFENIETNFDLKTVLNNLENGFYLRFKIELIILILCNRLNKFYSFSIVVSK